VWTDQERVQVLHEAESRRLSAKGAELGGSAPAPDVAGGRLGRMRRFERGLGERPALVYSYQRQRLLPLRGKETQPHLTLTRPADVQGGCPVAAVSSDQGFGRLIDRPRRVLRQQGRIMTRPTDALRGGLSRRERVLLRQLATTHADQREQCGEAITVDREGPGEAAGASAEHQKLLSLKGEKGNPAPSRHDCTQSPRPQAETTLD
jgi:hypothetical protein